MSADFVADSADSTGLDGEGLARLCYGAGLEVFRRSCPFDDDDGSRGFLASRTLFTERATASCYSPDASENDSLSACEDVMMAVVVAAAAGTRSGFVDEQATRWSLLAGGLRRSFYEHPGASAGPLVCRTVDLSAGAGRLLALWPRASCLGFLGLALT